jgi:glycosyltransferase involved in cell wall biosynthesis
MGLTLQGGHGDSIHHVKESKTRFLGALQSFNPDIIQVGPLTEPGSLVSSIWQGPIIATSWGFDLLSEAAESPQLKSAALATLRRAALLFVDSDATRDEALRQGYPASAIAQFPWGVEEFWFDTPPPRKSRGPSLHVLSTRNHEPIYRVLDVIRGVALAIDFGAKLHLTLAGQGSQTQTLRDECQGLGIGQSVTFSGRVSRTDLQEMLFSSDLYITASSIDGSSLSLLEAMASGAPVLASNIAGNRQWVEDSTGLLFEVGDVNGLAQSLLRAAATDPLTLQENVARANAARDRVVRLARWSDNVGRFPGWAALAMQNHQDLQREAPHDDRGNA